MIRRMAIDDLPVFVVDAHGHETKRGFLPHMAQKIINSKDEVEDVFMSRMR